MLLIALIFISLEFQSGFAWNSDQLEWQSFKVNYDQKYSNLDEEKFRKDIFQAKLEKIRLHNHEYELGLQSYKTEINQFTDRTVDELAKLTGCCRESFRETAFDRSDHLPESLLQLSKDDLPKELDYREHGAVTSVKDQDVCGSCWAFSVTGVLESHNYLLTKKLESLSAQHLIDCAPNTYGCDGGHMKFAYEYILKNKGIASEKAYPYEARDDFPCSYNDSMKAAAISSIVRLPEGNETMMQIALAQHGPLSVAVHVNGDFFQYGGGIFHSQKCRKGANHAVLVVGYGTDNKTGLDYWIVKNSWGEKFGENGYIRMSRNKNNNCDIASYASYPVMKKLK